MTAPDPYAAPRATVADAQPAAASGDYVPEGRALPSGAGIEWLRQGWRLYLRQPGMWVGLSLLFFLVYAAAGVVPFVGGVVTMLFSPAMFAGLLIACRDLEGGREIEVAHLFAGFRERAGPLIALGALYLAAMAAVMLVAFLLVGAGAAALFVGGGRAGAEGAGAAIVVGVLIVVGLVMPVAIAFWMATPLVLFHDARAADALRSSFLGCLKNWLPFLVYSLVLAALAIAASLPLFLGWLVLMPVFYASYYASYRDIFTRAP